MVCADPAAIWIVLKRACWPEATRRREIGRSRALATRRRQASLARPSTGGAVTRSFRTPPASPTIPSREAFGEVHNLSFP
jgi:hypothetical protein